MRNPIIFALQHSRGVRSGKCRPPISLLVSYQCWISPFIFALVHEKNNHKRPPILGIISGTMMYHDNNDVSTVAPPIITTTTTMIAVPDHPATLRATAMADHRKEQVKPNQLHYNVPMAATTTTTTTTSGIMPPPSMAPSDDGAYHHHETILGKNAKAKEQLKRYKRFGKWTVGFWLAFTWTISAISYQ
jgi:hypothetical protein